MYRTASFRGRVPICLQNTTQLPPHSIQPTIQTAPLFALRAPSFETPVLDLYTTRHYLPTLPRLFPIAPLIFCHSAKRRSPIFANCQSQNLTQPTLQPRLTLLDCPSLNAEAVARRPWATTPCSSSSDGGSVLTIWASTGFT